MTRTKKVTAILAAVALAVTLGAPAYALGDMEADRTVSAAVTVQDETYSADLEAAASEVDVAVYKVADVNEHGAFTLTEAFASLAEETAWNGGILNYQYGDDQMVALLEAALALVTPAEPAEGEESPEPTAGPAAPAEPIAPDATVTIPATDGTIPFDAYGYGLYLLVPGEARTAEFKYTFNPMLLAVPSIDKEADAWVYDVPVQLKGSRESLITGLEIAKTLREYNATLGATTFLFEVVAVKDGREAYRNVVSLTFSGTGTQTVTVEGIPVGADVTVTEVYTGASYDVTDGQVSVEVPDLPLPVEGNYTRVPFTNTYTNERIPDGSVVNRYVFNGTGWDYEGEAVR